MVNLRLVNPEAQMEVADLVAQVAAARPEVQMAVAGLEVQVAAACLISVQRRRQVVRSQRV